MRKTLGVAAVLQHLLDKPMDEAYGLHIAEETNLSVNGCYLILDRLVANGMAVRERETDQPGFDAGALDPPRPARIYYRITGKGERYLSEVMAPRQRSGRRLHLAGGND